MSSPDRVGASYIWHVSAQFRQGVGLSLVVHGRVHKIQSLKWARTMNAVDELASPCEGHGSNGHPAGVQSEWLEVSLWARVRHRPNPPRYRAGHHSLYAVCVALAK